MRLILTAARLDERPEFSPDAVDIEAAADDMWGELYVGPDDEPVEYVTLDAAVIDRPALEALIAAAEVGLDGIEDHETAETVAGVLSTLRSTVATLETLEEARA